MPKKRSGLPSETKEKISLVVFLVLAIVILIVLFRAPKPTSMTTAKAISSLWLEKTTYEAGEEINGTISIHLEPQDLLPASTLIKVFVKPEVEKCQTEYVCRNGMTVEWYRYNETTQTCELVNPDPEMICCLRDEENCKQRILNSGFEKGLDWWKITTVEGLSDDSFGTNFIDCFNSYNEAFCNSTWLNSTALFLETSYILPNYEKANITIKQDLGTRSIKVHEFCEENWVCDEWRCGLLNPGTNSCTCHRECTDLNNCGTEFNKPPTTKTGHGDECLSPEEPPPYSSYSSKLGKETNKKIKEGLTFSSQDIDFGLSFKVYWFTTADEACAFEIVLKGENDDGDERNLHYYYKLNDECPMPSDTAKDKYISRPLSQEQLKEEKINVVNDWISKGWSYNDTIKAIAIIAHGKFDSTSGIVYGQKVYFDDVKLKLKAKEVSNRCEERSTWQSPKQCCLAGTGYGNYYGNQLECDEGYECWSHCAPYIEKTLDQLTRTYGIHGYNKYNKSVYGEAKAVIDGQVIELGCYGGDWLNEGEGFTACIDTSSSAPYHCRDWDNTYEAEIKRLSQTRHFKAPLKEGNYELVFRVEYNSSTCPPDQANIVIAEKSIAFSVGTTQQCIPNWVNCTNQTICNENTNYTEIIKTVCVDANDCGIPCPPDVCINYGPTGNRCEPTLRPCDEQDYSCDEWQPIPCSPDENLTRNCELIDPTICNESDPSSVMPETSMLCNVDVITSYVQEKADAGVPRKNVEKELISLGWPKATVKEILDDVYGKEKVNLLYVWILLVVVLIVAFIILMFRAREKMGKKKVKVPAELISYVKDALAAGASKAEIKAKLLEVGWPKEVVDEALKSS